jgi:predicted transcriptional regulator
MNTAQMVMKACARLVHSGLAEYFNKDGENAIRLTNKGRKLVGPGGELGLLAKVMRGESLDGQI